MLLLSQPRLRLRDFLATHQTQHKDESVLVFSIVKWQDTCDIIAETYVHCTMVILVWEGRKKFGFPSKPNYGVITDTKRKFRYQNDTKNRYKPKKLDIFEVKIKNSMEYTMIKI